MIWLTAALALAYLLGSVPFGLLVGRAFGVEDVRRQGSGNIGATNVLRATGKWGGILTLLLDMAKGALPVLAASLLPVGVPPWGSALMGLAAFLGHLFPIYLGFKGGKGVATGLGVVLAVNPLAGGLALVIWLGMAFTFKISSLAALTAFAILPVPLWLLGPMAALPSVAAMTLLIFWKHQDNIQRLRAGTEPRIGKKE